jgi:hypothetical protein
LVGHVVPDRADPRLEAHPPQLLDAPPASRSTRTVWRLPSSALSVLLERTMDRSIGRWIRPRRQLLLLLLPPPARSAAAAAAASTAPCTPPAQRSGRTTRIGWRRSPRAAATRRARTHLAGADDSSSLLFRWPLLWPGPCDGMQQVRSEPPKIATCHQAEHSLGKISMCDVQVYLEL